MNNFTENDYKVLMSIINRNDNQKGLCKLRGTTIKEIVANTKLSDKKVRHTIKLFKELGFIEEGYRKVRERTYILTKDGIKELKSLGKNIFGEVINNG